ncbi:MAG: hypothetical protein RL038_649 [Actinomycetota bacterium]
MSDSQTTLVIEDGVIPRRVRRPVDLLRMVTAIGAIVAITAAATILLRTVSGIDADVADSAAKLPAVVAILLSAIAGLGQIVLPATVATDMIVKRRIRLLFEAISSAVVAGLVVATLTFVLREYGSDDLWFALAGTTDRTDTPLQEILAGLAALLTVSRLRGFSAKVVAFLLVATFAADIILAGYTVAAQAISVLTGWAIGLATRYLLGTPTVRPRGITIASELTAAGYPVSVLRAIASTKQGRRYQARTSDNRELLVVVYDRDLEGAGVLPRWWRSVRLRDDDALGGWKMREAVDRSTLMSNAAFLAGADVPRLLVVRSIGDDAVLTASEWVNGQPMDQLVQTNSKVSQGILEDFWRNLSILHQSGIAHRAISASHLLLTAESQVKVLSINNGAIAMTELQRRVDITNALVTSALLSNAEQAVNTAISVMGRAAVTSAVTTMQPLVLNVENRRALKGHKKLLGELRQLVAQHATSEEVQDIPFERMSPRKAITIVGGLVAAYLLFGQLAQVNLIELFQTANYSYVAWGAFFSFLTYVGAAMAVDGFVLEKLPLRRTFLAQLASSFAALVSPPALGTVAVNTRYLLKTGLSAATAGATVAVSQTLAFVIHIALMFAAGVAAGSAQDFKFHAPESAIAIGLGVVLLLLAVLPLPAVRKYLVRIAAPRIAEIAPRLITVASRPQKMLVGIGGMLLLNISFSLTLIMSVWAFNGGGSVAAIALVYLAGSTLGQAAPTPGGIGAVETVMTAGLVAAGIDSGVALSSVLLYRLLTFWLPTIPGWFAFRYLTKKDAL